MAVAHVNGIEMYYEVHGTLAPAAAVPLLLIMGWEANTDWWSGRLLRRLAADRPVIAFDNRGAGRTQAPGGSYDVPLMARDAEALLDVLGLGRVDVFGISMGGMIAQQLALDAPARVRRMVLGCTTSRPRRSVRFTARHRRMLKTYLTRGRHGWRGLQYAFRFSRLPEAPALREHVVQVTRAPISRADSLRQLAGLLRFDSTARLPEITMPALVLAGTADLMIPPDHAATLAARLPDARLVLLDGLGHLFFNQAPDEVARLVTDFLAGAARSEAA